MSFKFGDILINGWASEDNPSRYGIFVKKVSKGYELTDGKGKFWVTSKDNHKLSVIGNSLNITLGDEREMLLKLAKEQVLQSARKYDFSNKTNDQLIISLALDKN